MTELELDTLPKRKAARGAVVYCDDIHHVARSFTHAFNGHDDFPPSLRKGIMTVRYLFSADCMIEFVFYDYRVILKILF
mgnify:FL=1